MTKRLDSFLPLPLAGEVDTLVRAWRVGEISPRTLTPNMRRHPHPSPAPKRERGRSGVLIWPDRERADRDDVAIAVVLDAVAERLVDRILFAGFPEPQPRTSGNTDSDGVPSG
jgi:hypothetical protein